MEALRRQAVSRCRLCRPSSLGRSRTWLVGLASIVPTPEIAWTLVTDAEKRAFALGTRQSAAKPAMISQFE